MADTDSRWGQRLDKIAYATAGVVGLIILCFPLVFSGQVNDQALRAEIEAFKKNADEIERGLKDEPPVPLRDILTKQWDPGVSPELTPAWVTERAPALIRKIPKAAPTVPVHKPGEIKEISCQRDAEKKVPYLVVKGTLSPENEHVVIKKVTLLRKEGSAQEYKPVTDIPVAKLDASKAFEYADYTVQAGKTYTYTFKDTAEKDPAAPATVKPLPGEQKEMPANELGPTQEVPQDFSLIISTMEPLKVATDTPKFFGKFSYWDYKQGKVVDVEGGKLVSFMEKQKVGEGNRYEFFNIDDASGSVEVRDLLKNARHKFLKKDSRIPRAVVCWAQPLLPAATEGTGEGAEEAPAPVGKAAGTKPAKEEKKAPTPPKPQPGETKKEDTKEKPKKGGIKFK